MIKKLMILFTLFILLSLGAIFVSDYLTISQTKDKIYDSVTEIPVNKVGLVLGTSKYISEGRLNGFYTRRINAAVDLHQAGKIEFVLVSGDNATEQYNETDTMREDLINLGIPEDKIYGDYAGFRTLDSVVRAKEIFGQESYTIITQEFHLERAIYIARSQGINAIGYEAREVAVSRAPRVWIRERLARVKMMIDIVLGVEPKFGGEKIDII